MKRSWALSLAVLTMLAARAAAADEAMELASKLTADGAAVFNTADAKKMAASYTEDGKITLESRENDRFTLKEYVGRQEIEVAYEDFFKDREPGSYEAKNTVEYAKLLADDMLIIAGVFDLDTRNPDSIKVPFFQVRVKQDGKWLTSSIRIFVVGKPK